MTYRIGHDFLVGKTTLQKVTIIDILDKDHRFQIYSHDDGGTSELYISDGDIFAHQSNGIDRPDTQDVAGRFTLEPLGQNPPHIKLDIGTKVKFKAEHQHALIEIEGYVVRNFWTDYYLVTEQGVSIPNRYWKIGYDQLEQVS